MLKEWWIEELVFTSIYNIHKIYFEMYIPIYISYDRECMQLYHSGSDQKKNANFVLSQNYGLKWVGIASTYFF